MIPFGSEVVDEASPSTPRRWTVEHCEVVDYGSVDLEPARVIRNERGLIVAVLLDDGKIARAPGDYAYCTAQNPAKDSFASKIWSVIRKLFS